VTPSRGVHISAVWPVSRIFISHSSANNAEAIALRDWMRSQGWDDVFLDLDPERGLKAGQRWQDELKRAANQCELVIFLISPAWAQSKWCLMPIEMTAEWQTVDLTAGNRDQRFTVTLPPGNTRGDVSFAGHGLNRLRLRLLEAGLDAKHFAWPPPNDLTRPPYRGLRPLESDDDGIFFGREAPVIEAIDRLRGLAETAPPSLMVILGASGAGKSSFLRAGLLPRLGMVSRRWLLFLSASSMGVGFARRCCRGWPMKSARGSCAGPIRGGHCGCTLCQVIEDRGHRALED
jgi:TIR domain